jgi:hypothetical protein
MKRIRASMARTVVVLAAMVAVTTGCSDAAATSGDASGAGGEAAALDCDDLELQPTEAAVVVLADGRSPALDRFTDELVRDAAATFASPRLGLDADPGVVLLATYDERGQVHTVGRFSLAGVGPERVRRAADANRQAGCLAEALDGLPDASGGHLLRAVPVAIGLTEPLAERSVIVATGLGRAVGDGFTVAETELGSPDSRSHVLDQLERAGFVPALDAPGLDLVVLAPGEDVASGLVAADVGRFAADLCDRSGAGRCEVQEVLP